MTSKEVRYVAEVRTNMGDVYQVGGPCCVFDSKNEAMSQIEKVLKKANNASWTYRITKTTKTTVTQMWQNLEISQL